MAFIFYLQDSGKQYSTIQSYLSAITFAHKVRGLSDPTDSFLLKKFLLGTKRMSQSGSQLDPITAPMLLELIHLVDTLSTTSYNKALLRALMSLLYHGCLRISEVAHSGTTRHALKEDQVTFAVKTPRRVPDKLIIVMTSFKHSKATQTLEIRPSLTKAICPIRLLREYQALKPASTHLFCDKQGVLISRQFVIDWLQQLVRRSSFRSKRLNTHSFRIGRTTDLVLQGGVSDAYIRHVGRWSSNAYMKYVRSVVVL